MRTIVFAVALVAASSLAGEARAKPPAWNPGEPVLDGYHVERTSTDAALATGTALMVPTATFPLLALAAGPRAAPLLLPGIGPLIAIATLGYGPYSAAMLGLLGATQAAGVALFVWGVATPSVRLVTDRVEAPYPAPAGSHWEHYRPATAILSGATMLAVPWAFGVLFAAPWLSESPSNVGMLIPVVGPLIEMGVIGANAPPSSGLTTPLMMLLGIDAIMQGAGFGMILGGALHRSTYLVKDQSDAYVQLAPVGPAGSPGLSVVGTF